MSQLPRFQCVEYPLKFKMFRKKNLTEGMVRVAGYQGATHVLQIISREEGVRGSVLTLFMVTCSYERTKCPCSPSRFLVLFPDLLKKINWEILNPSLNLIQTLPVWISPTVQLSFSRLWATPQWTWPWLFRISGPVPITASSLWPCSQSG